MNNYLFMTRAIAFILGVVPLISFGKPYGNQQMSPMLLTEETTTTLRNNNNVHEDPLFITYKDAVYYTMNMGTGIFTESSIEKWLSKAGLQKVHAERYIWDLDWGGNSPAISYCWGKGVSFQDWNMTPTENDYFGVNFSFFLNSDNSGHIKALTIITSSKSWYEQFMANAKSSGFVFSEDLDKEIYGKGGKRYVNKPSDREKNADPDYIIDDFSISGKYSISFQNLQDVGIGTMTEEYSESPNEQKATIEDSKIIIEEVITRNEWNYQLNKNQDISYRVVRYKDGTTEISNGRNSWMRFKTECVMNEYTGESTNKYVNADEYINNWKGTTLVSARRDISDDYTLEVANGELSLYYKPLDLTYSVRVDNISSKVWSKPPKVNELIDTYFQDKHNGKSPVVTVKGPNGNTLDLVDAGNFKDVAGLIHKGGYYDKTTQKMYYIKEFSKFFIRGMNTYVMQLYSNLNSPDEINKALKSMANHTSWIYARFDSLKLSSSEIIERVGSMNFNVNPKYEISLVYCLPSDTIQRVVSTDKIVEIDYANGDYLKFSKLKEGAIYDCHVHRPNGVWTVKLNDEGKRESEFVYTNGRYKGLVYKDDFEYSEYAKCMSFPEMIMHTKRLYEPSRNRFVNIRDNGEIYEYWEERMEAERRERSAEFKQKSIPIYQAYCQKYGKANVDEILTNKNIKVGMPLSVIKALCHCSITDQSRYGEWYHVWFSGYEFDFENKRIKSNDVKILANEWYIRVSNGVVDYVGYW